MSISWMDEIVGVYRDYTYVSELREAREETYV